MVSLSVPTPRHLVAGALAGALLTGTLSGAGPSSAAAGESTLRSGGYAEAGADSSGFRCTATGNETSDVAAAPTGGGRVSTSFSSRPQLTGRPGDVVDVSLSSKATAAVQLGRGTLRRFDLTAKVAAGGDFTRGAQTECRVLADASVDVAGRVSVPEGFLTVRLVVTGDAQGTVSLEQALLDGFSAYASTPSRSEAISYVQPGAYDLRLSGRALLVSPETDASPTTMRGTVRAIGSFVPVGGATGKARGPGKRFVTLAKRRACDAGTLTASITGRSERAAALRKVVVSVNGKRAGALTSPAPRRTLTTTKPGAGTAATLEATAVLKNGKRRSVSRSYVPCSG